MQRAVNTVRVCCTSRGGALTTVQRSIEPAHRKELASRALGRRHLKERLGQQAIEQHLVELSAQCERAVSVECLGQMPCRMQIEQHIAGAAVESKRSGVAGRKERDVADTADVDDGAWLGRGEYRRVEGGNQRSALSAGGEIATAEVGYDIDRGALRPGVPGRSTGR